MNALENLAVLDRICRRGGDIYVAPHDHLNPACGYAARITMPDASSRTGVKLYRGESSESASEALRDALRKVVRDAT